MPLLKKITIKGGIIGLWKITELPSDFQNLIPGKSADLITFATIKPPHRQVEFLCTRALLKELTGAYTTVFYHSDGRPYLKNSSKHISISHSKNMVALILNDNPAGIDVETTDRKVEKVAHKFLSENESADILKSTDQHFNTLLYWCAKEAVFKLSSSQGIDFRKQIFICSEKGINEGSLTAELAVHNKKQTILLNYTVTENNVIVWGVE